jgi:hypothetical protein
VHPGCNAHSVDEPSVSHGLTVPVQVLIGKVHEQPHLAWQALWVVCAVHGGGVPVQGVVQLQPKAPEQEFEDP